MSDPSHWWPGSREGADPRGTGTGPPPGSDRPTDGYYYPPGTTPGSRGPGAPSPARARRTPSPRGWTWTAVAALVVVILVSTHRINSDDVILFCVIVPSIILHEISHGWVALAFGDDTAKRAGRLTLNPLAHVDLVGTVIVPVLMILSGWGWFGWAKPVPVTVSKLRSPRNQGVLVALAGPATNALICVATAVLFHLLGGARAVEPNGDLALWAKVLFYLGLVNVWLTIFNMIPIPPLDGSALIERLLPGAWWPGYLRLRRYSLPLVLVVVVFASIIPDGNTTVLGHLSDATINWWLRMVGLG